MAGWAPNKLREFKLKPGAATLAAQLANVLRGDGTPRLFVDFYPADGFGFCWCNFQFYSSDEQRNVGGLDSAFLHDQIPLGRLKHMRGGGGGTAIATLGPWPPGNTLVR